MAYVDQYALGEDATFQHRVQVALLVAAKDVQGEAQGTYTVSQHAKRQQLARSVLFDPVQYVVRFARLVATNPVITASSVDGDLQFTLNTLWDDMAGVDASDLAP